LSGRAFRVLALTAYRLLLTAFIVHRSSFLLF